MKLLNNKINELFNKKVLDKMMSVAIIVISYQGKRGGWGVASGGKDP